MYGRMIDERAIEERYAALRDQLDERGRRLYAAAEGSDSADIPGISFPYDTPDNADLTLDTNALTPDECLDQVMQLLKARRIV